MTLGSSNACPNVGAPSSMATEQPEPSHSFRTNSESGERVPDDCRIQWEWAIGPEVVGASFSSGPIPWEAHVPWFRANLSDPCAILYTATYVIDEPVGQVRFQQAGLRATISIGLAKGFRGRGLGRTLLFLACERLFRESKVEAIDAYVKPDNEASIGLFSNSGFRRLGTESVGNQPAIHFVFERSV
jgi:UDP-2,4-diacetamido-2,4,6-trideoxy-beta-L-altropyranose hydrolase